MASWMEVYIAVPLISTVNVLGALEGGGQSGSAVEDMGPKYNIKSMTKRNTEIRLVLISFTPQHDSVIYCLLGK